MKKIRIGVAGLGVVGRGTYEILQDEAKNLQQKTGCELEIVAVSARKNKDFLSKEIKFYADAMQLAHDPEVDLVVELIGGTTIAKQLIIESLRNGKKVVTANKALLAQDGKEIANLCEKYQGTIGFEASCAGANPVIKAFKESFIGNKINEFYGILNGTCNFVLTKMAKESLGYEVAIKQAQDSGFAEADPTLDVKGFDAAHKLTILAAIACGVAPDFSKTYIEGIDKISIDEIKLASDLGYKIKLLGVFKSSNNEVFQGVYPALIQENEKIAQVDGSYNALLTHGSNFEWNMMIGRGAGGRTTGSAAVADIVDIACGRNNSPLFGIEVKNYAKPSYQTISDRFGRYFIKLIFEEKNLTNGDIIERFFANKIKASKVSFISKINENSQLIICGILTENHSEGEIVEILSKLDKSIFNEIKFIRVEETNF